MKILYGVAGEGMGHAMRSRVVLERLGYGRAADALDDAAIHGFPQAVPGCEERLATYEQDGNERLYAELDRQLERLA